LNLLHKLPSLLLAASLSASGFFTLAMTMASTFAHAVERYHDVLALKPVAFWPANEGEGTQLRDLAETGNHANVFNTTWVGKTLNFTGAFEFVEIPENAAYMSKEFSLGAWVFVRRQRAGHSDESRGTQIIGNWSRDWRKRPGPISLRLTGKQKLTVEIVSNGKKDALGSVAAGIRIKSGTWQHLFYTFKDGEGKLFLDGKLASSKKGIEYTPQEGVYIAGSDSRWWFLYPPRAEALDGSLRDIVLFDRAIGETETLSLVNAGKPLARPHVLAGDELRLHGRFIKLRDLNKISQEDQRLAIRLMRLSPHGWTGSVEANAGILKTYLAQALQQPLTRYDAALLLEKMQDIQTLAKAKSKILDTIGNKGASSADRATATLALARMGSEAKDALDMLTTLLREDVEKRGTHVLRVEDAFRNALITALLAIDVADASVRELLGTVYAKPILDGMDMTKPYMEKVRGLVAQRRFMDALDACKPVIKKHKLFFLSQSDPFRDQRSNDRPNLRAYTAVDEYNGSTYKFGEGEAFKGCAPITRADYERALGVHAKTQPEAKKWLDGNIRRMFRADLKKIASDGSVQTVYMGGENFIFSGRDLKVTAWSVAVDKHGYIHAIGGQHNRPHYSEFMPGAWESLGLSKDRRDQSHPTTMYWVSKRPEDITEFEFVGRKGHPQNLPVRSLNYTNFVQDRKGELYLYGRNDIGIQNWSFCHYHADTRRWHDLGGARADVFTSARKANPEWVQSVKQSIIYGYRGTIPSGKDGEYPSLSWGWQPNFYNYIRSTRGIQFDPENRMYIQIPTYAYDANKRVRSADLFAYSNDGGKTFHRADGESVKLPLTSNPAPEYNADILKGYNEIWIKQWVQLIKRVGFVF